MNRVGVVTTLRGTAILARTALPQPMPLKLRDDVYVADRITTGNEAYVRILMGGKAVVTVRERSTLTITDVPGRSTVEVGTGRIALAVVKDRMKPGEEIEIRTPNAVAGIRGTVVITEVSQATAQLGSVAGAFTTTITVLRGAIEVRQLDALTRQPTGAAVSLGALRRVSVTGRAPLWPAQRISPEARQRIADDFTVTIKDAAPALPSLVEGQMRQAVIAVSSPARDPRSGPSHDGSDRGDAATSSAPADPGPAAPVASPGASAAPSSSLSSDPSAPSALSSALSSALASALSSHSFSHSVVAMAALRARIRALAVTPQVSGLKNFDPAKIPKDPKALNDPNLPKGPKPAKDLKPPK